jgi:hypothetical protein
LASAPRLAIEGPNRTSFHQRFYETGQTRACAVSSWQTTAMVVHIYQYFRLCISGQTDFVPAFVRTERLCVITLRKKFSIGVNSQAQTHLEVSKSDFWPQRRSA